MYPSRTLEEIETLMEQVDDYVRELSYGKTWIIPQVHSWVLMDLSAESYGVEAIFEGFSIFYDDNDSYMKNLMVKEAVTKVDSQINFMNFDRLLLYHAGFGRQSKESSGDSSRDKWIDTCHAPIYHITDESVLIEHAMIVAEFDESEPSIGAIVHELGHDFGAKDLYHPDFGPDIGEWCLMSSGNHLNDSQTPSHMCAYTKLQVGFLDQAQVVPITNGTYTFELVAISVDSDGFYAARFDIDYQGELYFLVEARKQIGYDSALTRSGVLVTLINMTTNDSQLGRVLLAPDSRYSEANRAYGPGEFFLDSESGFGVRVLNETDSGYTVEATTAARMAWQRIALIDHTLESPELGSMTTLPNGTSFIAFSGVNTTSGYYQVDVHKSVDYGFT